MTEQEWLTDKWIGYSSRLPTKLHKLLDETALKEGRSKVRVIARIIAAYYNNVESKV